jgi:hypothetical protein
LPHFATLEKPISSASGGFLSHGDTPKSSNFNRIFLINHPFWGTPHDLGNLYIYQYLPSKSTHKHGDFSMFMQHTHARCGWIPLYYHGQCWELIHTKSPDNHQTRWSPKFHRDKLGMYLWLLFAVNPQLYCFIRWLLHKF